MTGLKACEMIQTRVESTDDTSGMEMEARGWTLEIPQNLKLTDLAVDGMQKEREREKRQSGSTILNMDVCHTIKQNMEVKCMDLSSEIR